MAYREPPHEPHDPAGPAVPSGPRSAADPTADFPAQRSRQDDAAAVPAERPRSHHTDGVARLGGRRSQLLLVVAVLFLASFVVTFVVLTGSQNSEDLVRDRSARATSSTRADVPGAPAPGPQGAGGAGPSVPGAPAAPGAPGAPGGAPPPPGDVVLAVDGLGITRFGAPAAEAMAVLAAVLGPPDHDTGLVDPSRQQMLGACPAGRQRAVSWGQLTVGFVEGTTTYSGGAVEHLVMYRYGDPPVGSRVGHQSTATGASLGSTVGEVAQAYGAAAQVVEGDELVDAHVRVELGAPHPLVLQTADERVTSIRAGEPCA